MGEELDHERDVRGAEERGGAFVVRAWRSGGDLRARLRTAVDLDQPEEVADVRGPFEPTVEDVVGRLRGFFGALSSDAPVTPP